MEFFNSAIEVLKVLVMALGAGLAVWGVVNLLEGYGSDNPAANIDFCHSIHIYGHRLCYNTQTQDPHFQEGFRYQSNTITFFSFLKIFFQYRKSCWIQVKCHISFFDTFILTHLLNPFHTLFSRFCF